MVKNRIKTSFEISIPTGLALESIFEPTSERYDEDREIPNKVDFKNFNFLLINGYTLLRNILNSFEERVNFESIEKDYKKYYPDILDAINEEIDIINSLVISYNDKAIFKVFLPNYVLSFASFNAGKEGELAYINNTLALFKLGNYFFNRIDNPIVSKLQHSNLPSVYNIDKAIYLTHFPSDLLYCDNINLLESHTGVLKTKVDFYTKFSSYGKNSLVRIPFNKYTLFILGDHVFIKSLGIKAKRILYDLAEENKWSYRTNESIVYNKLLKTDIINEVKNFNTLYRR